MLAIPLLPSVFSFFPLKRKADASPSKSNFWLLSQELSIITFHGLEGSRHVEKKKRNGKTAMRLHVNMSSGLSTDDLCSVACTKNSGESGGTRIKDSCT